MLFIVIFDIEIWILFVLLCCGGFIIVLGFILLFFFFCCCFLIIFGFLILLGFIFIDVVWLIIICDILFSFMFLKLLKLGFCFLLFLFCSWLLLIFLLLNLNEVGFCLRFGVIIEKDGEGICCFLFFGNIIIGVFFMGLVRIVCCFFVICIVVFCEFFVFGIILLVVVGSGKKLLGSLLFFLLSNGFNILFIIGLDGRVGFGVGLNFILLVMSFVREFLYFLILFLFILLE